MEKKIKVVLTGVAEVSFVRTMYVYADEVDELLNNEEMIACNLDHPDACEAINEWKQTFARKEEN